MKLVSVNIGRPRPVSHRGGVVSTGIYKALSRYGYWLERKYTRDFGSCGNIAASKRVTRIVKFARVCYR